MISKGHTSLVVGTEAFRYIVDILEDREPLPLERGISAGEDRRSQGTHRSHSKKRPNRNSKR